MYLDGVAVTLFLFAPYHQLHLHPEHRPHESWALSPATLAAMAAPAHIMRLSSPAPNSADSCTTSSQGLSTRAGHSESEMDAASGRRHWCVMK